VEELLSGQAGLMEHGVEQGCRNVPSHLMAQADLKDLTGRKRLFPRFVLLGPDQAKAER